MENNHLAVRYLPLMYFFIYYSNFDQKMNHKLLGKVNVLHVK